MIAIFKTVIYIYMTIATCQRPVDPLLSNKFMYPLGRKSEVQHHLFCAVLFCVYLGTCLSKVVVLKNYFAHTIYMVLRYTQILVISIYKQEVKVI